MIQKRLNKNYILLTMFLLFSCRPLHAQGAKCSLLPYRLLTSGRNEPLEVAQDSLRFSWALGSPSNFIRRDSRQTEFQLCLWECGPDGLRAGDVVWESGRLSGPDVRALRYGGPKLRARSAYTWNLRVWDEKARPSKEVWARFHTAAPPNRPIRGSWIGSGGTFRPLESPSEGFLSSTVLEQDVPHQIVIDLGRIVKADQIALHPTSPFRAATQLTGMGFPQEFTVKTSLSSRPESFKVVFSDKEMKGGNLVGKPIFINLNKHLLRFVLLETKKRYVLSERSFVSLAEIEVFEAGKNVALNCPVYSSDETVSMSYASSFLVDGKIPKGLPDGRANGPASFLSKSFLVGEVPDQALLRLGVLGSVDVWINGVRLRDFILGPCDSDLDERIYYQSIDISEYLRGGRNRIELILGHGKAGGQVPDRTQSERSSWKMWPRVVAEVALDWGTREVVIGTDSTWSLKESYVIDQGLMNGETHDGRLQRKWQQVKKEKASHLRAAVTMAAPNAKLLPQFSPPWSLVQSITASRVQESVNNETVVDFGRNLFGTFRIRLQGKAGGKVKFDLREQLDNNGKVDLVSSAWSTLGRFQHYEFLLSGEEDVFEPRLSLSGFRYMSVGLPKGAKIVGAPEALVVASELKSTLKFAIGHKDLVKLRRMAVETLQSCRHGTPVDCPQRERSGWLLDGYITARSFMSEWRSELWYRKWLIDMMDSQNDSGFVPSSIPSSDLFDAHGPRGLGHFADPWWGGVICFLAVDFYEFYGDRDFLMRIYPSMKKWVDFLRKSENRMVQGWGLGDWHEPHGKIEKTPISLVATAGYHRAVHSCELAAGILGKETDVQNLRQLREEVEAAWCRAFPQNEETGLFTASRESGQIIALVEKFVNGSSRAASLKALLAQIGSGSECNLDSGYVTTSLLLSFLLEEGLGDVALDVILNRSEASWMRFVDLGYSTMPERWRAHSDSLNHLPLSCVDEAILRLAGFCQPTLNGVGFRKFQVWPQAMKRLKSASWEFESPQGRIACAWRFDKSVTMTLTVPPGSECALVIPTNSMASLTVDNLLIKDQSGFQVIPMDKFRQLLLPAGEFQLAYDLKTE